MGDELRDCVTVSVPLVLIIGLAAGLLPELRGAQAAGQKNRWTVPAKVRKMKNPLADDPSAREHGRALYKLRCAMCHGEKGRGDGPVAESLTPRPTDLIPAVKKQTDGELFWKISKGRLPMPGFELTLSERDRWALVSFLTSGL